MGGAVEMLYSDAIHIREQAKIDAARITQKGRNERAAAGSDLARWTQSLSNQRRMKAAGETSKKITENIGRNLDAATTGSFMGRLAASEELGANLVQAAAAGVGGSTIEVYNSTMKLNRLMQEENSDRAVNTDLLEASAARGRTIVDAVEGSDFSANMANLDYSQFVDHKKMSGMSKVLGVAGAAAATYFGGPKAGAAVFDAVSANHRAVNGDFDGASQRLVSAFQNGVEGGRAFTKGAKNGSMGEAWGKSLWASTRKRLMSGSAVRIG